MTDVIRKGEDKDTHFSVHSEIERSIHYNPTMKVVLCYAVLLSYVTSSLVHGLEANSRRGFLQSSASAIVSTCLPNYFGAEKAFAANDDDGLIDVYFGVGCFWHVQHEFVEAEARLLGRRGTEYTSRTGYAGK